MMQNVKRRSKKDELTSSSFVWTDDEVELLLKVTNEYKVVKGMGTSSDLSVYENTRLRPFTRKRIAGVFENTHFEKRFKK